MEKAYKTMQSGGAFNIAFGVILIMFGLTAGILSIVNGALLLKRKSALKK